MFLFYFLIFSSLLIVIIKKAKQQGYKNFSVKKLLKFQKNLRNAFISVLICVTFIIYFSFVPTFILFIILAWFGLLFSLLFVIHSLDRLYLIKKSKKSLKSQLENTEMYNLLTLAKELGYPYSDLKVAIDYLTEKGEITKKFI